MPTVEIKNTIFANCQPLMYFSDNVVLHTLLRTSISQKYCYEFLNCLLVNLSLSLPLIDCAICTRYSVVVMFICLFVCLCVRVHS